MSEPRRKRKRTFNEPGHAHYLTFSTQQQRPLLVADQACWWVANALDAARQRHRFDLYAYVIMPQHVHVFVRPREEHYRIERFLADLKRKVSSAAKQHLIETSNDQWLQRLTVTSGTRKVFRFWKAGGGFDRNIYKKRSLWPVIEYIHANPVRKDLVKCATDWRWSSAPFWAGEADVPLKMDNFGDL